MVMYQLQNLCWCINRLLLCSLLLVSNLCFSGCGESTVAENLSQRQAQEIVTVLLANGINASLERTGRGSTPTYSITVEDRFFSRSIVILHEKGLPQEQRLSFDQIVGERGILPASRQIEQLRTDRALALEAESLLGVLPAVAEARVAVRLNSAPSIAAQTVAVVVQSRQVGTPTEGQVAKIVANVVPSVPRERMFITINAENEHPRSFGPMTSLLVGAEQFRLVPFLWLGRIPEDDYNRVALVLVLCVLMTAFAGSILGYWYGAARFARRDRRIAPGRSEELPPKEGPRQLENP